MQNLRDVGLPALYVHDDVLRHVSSLPHRLWEVGGWLLGYWAGAGTAIVVAHATPPGRRGTPFGVTVSADKHRPLFDSAYDASNGYVTFLGDWHTHPGGPTRPSTKDTKAMKQLADESDYGTPLPLIAIAAVPRWPLSKRPVEIRWWLRLNDGVIAELAPRSILDMPDVARFVAPMPW